VVRRDITDRCNKGDKSEDELEFIRKTAEMQDRLVDEVRGFIRPGLRDFEVMAFANTKPICLAASKDTFWEPRPVRMAHPFR